jgi:peptidoglycan/xylan/chitin deacetylase (PgdA/CDA1 family)
MLADCEAKHPAPKSSLAVRLGRADALGPALRCKSVQHAGMSLSSNLPLSLRPVDRKPIPVLMYHAFGAPSCALEASYTVTPGLFQRHLELLRAEGWTTLGIEALTECLRQGRPLPQRTVGITIDDGFACIHEHLGPELERGLKATAYVVSGSLDAMARFDRDLGIRARPMLSRVQLRELSDAGLEVGSHTVNHPDLRMLADAALENELVRSKNELEQLLGTATTSFAYPRGRFDRRVRQAVADAGYLSACCTLGGLNNTRTDALLIRRIQMGMHLDEPALLQALRQGGPLSSRIRRKLRQTAVPWIAALQGRDPLDLMASPLSLHGSIRSRAAAPSLQPASVRD